MWKEVIIIIIQCTKKYTGMLIKKREKNIKIKHEYIWKRKLILAVHFSELVLIFTYTLTICVVVD